MKDLHAKPGGAVFWTAAVLGGVVVGYGVVGAMTTGGVRPPALAAWVIGLAVVHDGLVAPAENLAGVALARHVLGRRRAAAQTALIIGATLTIFALPFVFGPGRLPDNPSLLPGHYGSALAGLLVGIGLVTGSVEWVVSQRRRRR